MNRLLCTAFLILLPFEILAADKPNVLFIFADDQCYDTINALGNEEIETPNLDRLVKQGTTFTHAYNMGGWNGAVCLASRAMIISGQWLWHASRAPIKTTLLEQKKLWPQLLEAQGYETYFSGKWHIRAPADQAFNHARNIRPGMPNQTKDGYNRPREGQPDTWSPYDPGFEGFWKGGKHWSEVLAEDGLEYLSMAAKKDNPFFMYLAFNAPHDPRQAPKEYVDKYPWKQINLPESFIPEYPYKEQIGSGKGLRDEKLAPFPRTEYAVKVNRQEYYAIITHMDAQIGRILEALEKSGKADNTYIFFSADHGLAVGNHGLMGKQNMYDHSVRVPLIVAGPGVEPNRKITARVYLQDIMATSLELAGAERPRHVQFQSLMPLLQGKTQKSYPAIYGAYVKSQRMVTEDDWKLLLYPNARVKRLYNLKQDPLERHDLAGEPGQLARMKGLYQTFRGLQKETGDELNLDAAFPELL